MEKTTLSRRMRAFINPSRTEAPRAPDLMSNNVKGKPRRIKKSGLSYSPGQGGSFNGGRIYEAPLFDLNEVRIACEVDSFVRRSINRHCDVFTKEGYVIKGNPKAVKYLRRRLAYMATMTGKPLSIFFGECAADFIKYHNVFLIKGRLDDGESLPGMTLRGITDKQPISAYFKIAAPTVSVARKRVGNEILMWLQTVNEFMPQLQTVGPGNLQTSKGGEPNKVLIQPRNMVHFYKDREEGEVFGTPFVLPTIPDVKTLREIEGYVVEMVHLFADPVVTWQVGTEANPGQGPDIEETVQQVEAGPVSGIYVIPGDQKITVHGAASGVDAIEYLQYFENRVFTGLGTSQTQMGRGDTANRSTATSMVSEFMDRVRGYHKDFAAFFNELIINELLLEAGFDVYDEEATAWIEFTDPDVDTKTVIYNQEIQKFTNFLTTRAEARERMGYDEWTEEDNDDSYLNLIKVPLAIIQAIDEPYTQDAKNALKNAGAPSTAQANPPDPNKPAGAAKPAGGGKAKAPANPNKPSNQHGTTTKKTKGSEGSVELGGMTDIRSFFKILVQHIRGMGGSYDEVQSLMAAMLDVAYNERISKNGYEEFNVAIQREFNHMRTGIVGMVQSRYSKDADHFNLGEASIIFGAFEDAIRGVMEGHLRGQFETGMRQCIDDTKLNGIDPDNAESRVSELLDHYATDWQQYTKLIYQRIVASVSKATHREEAVELTQGVFESLTYLVEAKAKTEYYHARNFGYGYAAYAVGEQALVIQHFSRCVKCGHKDRIALDGFSLYTLPPFHYNCECEVKVER